MITKSKLQQLNKTMMEMKQEGTSSLNLVGYTQSKIVLSEIDGPPTMS